MTPETRHDALVNPDLLLWARQSINLDIEEAADRIGVKTDRLFEWESGSKKPTINQARKMSQVYRRPLATFFLPRRPQSLGFSVPHDFRRLPTEEQHPPTPELIAELRRIEYLREAAIELSDEPPQEPQAFVNSVNLDEQTDSVAARVIEILQMPMGSRTAWRSEYDALNGWKDAIERHGVLVMHLGRVEIEEIRGIAIAEKLFPLIAINGKDSPTGRVFTLIHEFIHVLLGATGMSNLRFVRSPRTLEQRTEHFCNQAAGEVLVPRLELFNHERVTGQVGPRKWPDEIINDLSRYFRVSREVVVRRLRINGLATDDFYRAKRHQYAREREISGKPTGGPLPMSRRILRAIGQPFARIALDAYYREAISGSELAELLGARLKHLPAVQELLAGRNTLTGGDW